MTEVVDEKKYHTLDPKKKPLYIIAGAFLVVIILPAVMYLYYDTALNRPAQQDAEKVFVIKKGENVSSISQRLYDDGLVNSKMLFNSYIIYCNLQSKLQAGTYTIPAGSSVKKLSELFQRGRSDIKITFLEGWRAEEVAREASTKLESVGYRSFIDMAKKYEGSLFPDTYDFNAGADEETIINTMRENFTVKTRDILTDASLAKIGLDRDQVLILASIIEREVAIANDRKIVAGILIKRLKEGMTLGADATVQYAVAPDDNNNWWPKNLTADNLDIQSPYNTRKIVGLPPTPICNPGLEAIKAVIEPQSSEYYYYITDSEDLMHFARTLNEHNRNIAKYLSY